VRTLVRIFNWTLHSDRIWTVFMVLYDVVWREIRGKTCTGISYELVFGILLQLRKLVKVIATRCPLSTLFGKIINGS
jgi:hypothetical protein